MTIRRLIFGLLISFLLFSFIFAASRSRAELTPMISPEPTPGLLAPVHTPVTAGIRYRLDAGQSRFTVHALVGGLLSSFGHNHTIAIREFSGEADVTPNSIQPASLQMTIKADSLTVTDKVSAKDKQEIESKMRNEVLETAQHPNIIFKSTSISAAKTAEGQYDAQIWGDVTLHGVTKSIWFKAQLTVSGNSLRAKGDFALRQSEFKIKPVSAAGGTIKVKDELKFAFEIVGVK